jgi:hypothetical protein
MAKPNYASLLAQIAAETDPAIKANLVAQCYVFPEALTEEEKQLFEYCNTDYIESNPGIVGNALASYVGKYYNDQGEET